jgi:tRNA(adenine34) deaminase
MTEDGGAHERFMQMALVEARRAREAGEVPVGAVLTLRGEVVAAGSNEPIAKKDSTAHAEIVALRRAARVLGNYRLLDTTLYVTLEPCLMCAGALVNARVARLVFGAREPKWGAVRSLLDLDSVRTNHAVEVVEGVLEDECRRLVVEFFRNRRSTG